MFIITIIMFVSISISIYLPDLTAINAPDPSSLGRRALRRGAPARAWNWLARAYHIVYDDFYIIITVTIILFVYIYIYIYASRTGGARPAPASSRSCSCASIPPSLLRGVLRGVLRGRLSLKRLEAIYIYIYIYRERER